MAHSDKNLSHLELNRLYINIACLFWFNLLKIRNNCDSLISRQHKSPVVERNKLHEIFALLDGRNETFRKFLASCIRVITIFGIIFIIGRNLFVVSVQAWSGLGS